MLLWLVSVDNVGHYNVPYFAEQYAPVLISGDGDLCNFHNHSVRAVEVERERLISIGRQLMTTGLGQCHHLAEVLRRAQLVESKHDLLGALRAESPLP
jgi:hypothetical protein